MKSWRLAWTSPYNRKTRQRELTDEQRSRSEADAISPWTVLNKETLFSAPPWVELSREKVRLPSGKVIDDFYRLVLPDFVSIVTVTASGQFVMVRGYKHGMKKTNLSPPAGMIDPGESPVDAAKRELLEETGFSAAEWNALGSFVVDGNRQCGTMHLFLATNAHRTQDAQYDETEELNIELMSRDQIVTAVQNGEIGNLAGASSVALALLAIDGMNSSE